MFVRVCGRVCICLCIPVRGCNETCMYVTLLSLLVLKCVCIYHLCLQGLSIHISWREKAKLIKKDGLYLDVPTCMKVLCLGVHILCLHLVFLYERMLVTVRLAKLCLLWPK